MDAIYGMYVAIGVALTILLAIGWYYLSREVFNPAGKGAEKKTARILQKFALLRGFKVLPNISAGSCEIENMLVGYFGILLVKTLGMRGEYFGALTDENWTFSSAALGKMTIRNPVKQLEEQAARLREILSAQKIYNIPIETVVYIPNKSSKTAVYVTHNGEILLGGKLGGYLDRTRFEKDAGIDVEKVASAVLHGKQDI